MNVTTRFIWLTAGVMAVAIAALGVVLPLLPTTPFLLVAAFAFARSSERMTDWLHDHRIFGPLIGNWRRDGSIGRGAKWAAVAVMIAALFLTLWLDAPAWVVVCQIVVLSVAAIFVLTRPSPSEEPF